jgi:hypothetical protein
MDKYAEVTHINQQHHDQKQKHPEDSFDDVFFFHTANIENIS